MSFLISAPLAALMGVAAAPAADLAPKTYVKAPAAPAPAYDWTGFYVGANMGFGAASDRLNMSFTPAIFGGEQPMMAPAGWLGGVQLGYNFQAGRWVLGVEGDAQASALRQSICFDGCRPAVTSLAVQELSWFATARGRVGYTMGPALIYATGGAAFTSVRTSLSEILPPSPSVVGTFDDARTGWVLGGGIEAALGGHWTAKVEYLYMDFGSISHVLPDVFLGAAFPNIYAIDIREHVFRVGVNYLFNDPSRGAAAGSFAGAYAMMPTVAYNWTGFYVGGNLGAGVANGPATLGFDNIVSNQTNFAARSLNGGLQAGANWQTRNLVLGIEGDIQFNDQSQKDCFGFCLPAQSIELATRLPWFATLRGRIGYNAGRLLFYGTAGAALGRVETNYVDRDDNFVLASGNFGEVKSGWTAGGGIEAALSERWTAKAEYLYLDLGSVTHAMPDTVFGVSEQFSTTVHDHIIRVGLNYKVGP
jgi:outer membrane immunogenic protein